MSFWRYEIFENSVLSPYSNPYSQYPLIQKESLPPRLSSRLGESEGAWLRVINRGKWSLAAYLVGVTNHRQQHARANGDERASKRIRPSVTRRDWVIHCMQCILSEIMVSSWTWETRDTINRQNYDLWLTASFGNSDGMAASKGEWNSRVRKEENTMELMKWKKKTRKDERKRGITRILSRYRSIHRCIVGSRVNSRILLRVHAL